MIDPIHENRQIEPCVLIQVQQKQTGAFWEIAGRIREIAIEILKNPIVQEALDRGIDKMTEYAKERVKEALGEKPTGEIDVTKLAFEMIDFAAKQAREQIKQK